MSDYEKLVMMLEMKGLDVSKFIQLKKNELLLYGSKEITEPISFKELVQEQYHFINPLNGYNNPFFTGLGSKKQTENIDEISIYHYKNNTYQTIEEVMEDENLMMSQRQDVVYRGFQQLSNEYKIVLENIYKADTSLINSHIKLAKVNDHVITPKLLRKRNLLFWLYGMLLIAFDTFIIKDTYLKENLLYVICFNIVFNIFILFPLVKIAYSYYIKRESIQKELIAFKKHYERLLDMNDSNIEKFEDDLYIYYGSPTKKINISYLKKINIEFKNVRDRMNKVMNKNSQKTGKKMIRNTIKLVHILTPISFFLLVILYFII